MRLRRLMVAALVLVAIGSAARPLPQPGQAGADPSTVLHLQPAVPDPVLSTLRQACFDFHSETTRWPWYATLPIASQVIERDVTEARGQLNLSRWTDYNRYDRATCSTRCANWHRAGRCHRGSTAWCIPAGGWRQLKSRPCVHGPRTRQPVS